MYYPGNISVTFRDGLIPMRSITMDSGLHVFPILGGSPLWAGEPETPGMALQLYYTLSQRAVYATGSIFLFRVIGKAVHVRCQWITKTDSRESVCPQEACSLQLGFSNSVTDKNHPERFGKTSNFLYLPSHPIVILWEESYYLLSICFIASLCLQQESMKM